MLCNKCDNEAEYIINGESVCREHKGDSKPDSDQGKSQGQILAGM